MEGNRTVESGKGTKEGKINRRGEVEKGEVGLEKNRSMGGGEDKKVGVIDKRGERMRSWERGKVLVTKHLTVKFKPEAVELWELPVCYYLLSLSFPVFSLSLSIPFCISLSLSLLP